MHDQMILRDAREYWDIDQPLNQPAPLVNTRFRRAPPTGRLLFDDHQPARGFAAGRTMRSCVPLKNVVHA